MPSYLCNRLETNNVRYSETEKVVGKWIDGTPVYEKTVYYAGGVSGTLLIPHGITNLNRVITVNGSCHDIGYSQGGQQLDVGDMMIPRVAADGYNIGIVKIDSTNITMLIPNIFSTRITNIYIILRYTKTS